MFTQYTQDGRVKARIDERGNRTEYRYNALGHLTETIYDDTPDTLTDSPRMTVTYDNLGRVTETTCLLKIEAHAFIACHLVFKVQG
ncbi:MAG: RHS repeat protein [Leptolyngbya sp. SIO1E4]|nr:RHS repeat protein [Leptolyngbya sp. SIO1E4]